MVVPNAIVLLRKISVFISIMSVTELMPSENRTARRKYGEEALSEFIFSCVPTIFVRRKKVNLLLLGEREGDKGGPAVGRHDDAASVATALALVVRPKRDAVAGWSALVPSAAGTSLHLQ